MSSYWTNRMVGFAAIKSLVPFLMRQRQPTRDFVGGCERCKSTSCKAARLCDKDATNATNRWSWYASAALHR